MQFTRPRGNLKVNSYKGKLKVRSSFNVTILKGRFPVGVEKFEGVIRLI